MAASAEAPAAAATPRILVGPGIVGSLADLLLDMNTPRVLVVTDPGLMASGHVEALERALARANLRTRLHGEVGENPGEDDVDRCVEQVAAWSPDVLVGLGGGSAMDVAKGALMVHAGGGRMADYWGRGKAKGELLPWIAVPTTAGTGSETQSFALIGHRDTGQKMACGDARAMARAVLLDPELTVTAPREVTAFAAIDALVHGIESAVSAARGPVSDLYSEDAIVRILRSLPAVLADPADLEARQDLQLAAAHAGHAIEHSMLGAAHAMANPLTRAYGVTHGQAVGMTLPWVMEFNARDPLVARRYAELARSAGVWDGRGDAGAGSRRLRDALVGLLDAVGWPAGLSALGVPEAAAVELAPEAAEQWTGRFNPRTVGRDEFAALYAEAIGGR